MEKPPPMKDMKGENSLPKDPPSPATAPWILIVDDDEDICDILSRLMKREGLKARVAHDGETGLKLVQSNPPDVLLVDLKMPDMDGMEVLRRAKELDQDLPVVMITAYGGVHGAVEAIRGGAHDYLAKPFDPHEVIRVIRRALGERELKLKVKYLSSQIQETSKLREMMGPSDKVGRLIADVNRVAKSDFTVVILGETGTGKELVARAIHQASPRAEHLFVPVDCGAIPDTLLESELFGYEKGAFTGAEGKKPGRFEVAQKGTLFLDEISNMPLGAQAKLLRVLQERLVYPVGGTKPVSVDVRLLAASNLELQTLSASGSFRRDLFFRLNEFTITIPPLRDRKEDIPYLAKRFLDMTNQELSKNIKGFSGAALEVLLDYKWPGNVRQLRSTIRRAVLLADDLVTEEHLDVRRESVPGLGLTPKVEGIPWGELSLKDIVRRSTMEVEREVLAQALKYTAGNKAKAARMLQVDYKTLHTKLKQLGFGKGEG